MEFILKSALLIGIIYSFYKLFLQKETFFKSIRMYFIFGLLATVILPLLIIPIYIEVIQMAPFVPELAENIANFENEIFIETPITAIEEPFNWIGLLTSFYFIGVAFFSIKFVIQIFSLYHLIHKSNKQKNDKITFAETLKTISPFSIFNYIVYNKNQFKTNELIQIIAHEKVHVKQYHTYDMLLVHMLVIVQWFNPFAWLYKKDLQQNLEFLADKYAQENVNTLKEYQYLLLKTSIKQNPFALSNNFYNSLIKKRIIMLQKTPSKKLNQLKYILLVPILAVFLYAFNTKEIVKPVNETLFPNLVNVSKKKLIVIDVSHGGKDSGAKVENILEKDIVFKISKKIKSLYNGENELVFTREKDEFIILSDRIETINKLNPDLVISLHVNNALDNKDTNGLVAYVSENNVEFKKSKIIANKLLNAVANKKLKIKGFSKGNLLISRKVNSPSVVLELGFLSNKNDRNYINSEKGQTEIAKGIIAFLNNKETSNYINKSIGIKFTNPIHPANVTKVSSGFGMRANPFSKKRKFHNGIDLVAHKGTDVYATADGKVIKATYDKLKGNYIQIQHANNYQTNYHHLGKIQIALGEQVKAGDIISTVGNTGKSTGPHLHYEVVKDGKNIDPKSFLNYNNKNDTNSIKITSKTTDKELNQIVKKFNKDNYPSEIRFSEVIRNDDGEIRIINIETNIKSLNKFNKTLSIGAKKNEVIEAFTIEYIKKSNEFIFKRNGNYINISNKGTISNFSTNHNTKNKELDGYNIVIQSKTTDKKIKEIQKKFEQKNKVTLRIYNVKRNSNNEIIAIKIEGNSKDSSSSYSFSQDEPISKILLGYDKSNDEIIIENVSFGKEIDNKTSINHNVNKRSYHSDHTNSKKHTNKDNSIFRKGKAIRGIMITSKSTNYEIEKMVTDFKEKFKVNLKIYNIKRNNDNEIITLKVKANSKNASDSFSFNDDDSFYSITVNYLADRDEFRINKWDSDTKKHTVKSKDTYYSIARKHGLTVEELKILNPNKDFKIGTKLIIKKDPRLLNRHTTLANNTRIINVLDENNKVENQIVFVGDDIDKTSFTVNGKKASADELEKIDKTNIKTLTFNKDNVYIKNNSSSNQDDNVTYLVNGKVTTLENLKKIDKNKIKIINVDSNIVNIVVLEDSNQNYSSGSIVLKQTTYFYVIKNNKTTFYNKFGDKVDNNTSKKLLKLLKKKLN